jgi:hypothetical protein
MSTANDLYEAVLRGDSRAARDAARSAMAAEADAAQLFTAAVVPAMREMRRRFQAHEAYVPEMLIACRAMKAALNEIRLRLTAENEPPAVQVCVIALAYHAEDVTCGLVADLLEGAGFEVTRSSLAVPAADRVTPWRIAQCAAVVLVVPAVALIRDSACLPGPLSDAIGMLCRDRETPRPKVILVGGDPACVAALGLDGHVDDFSDVVPAVEQLTAGVTSA